MRTALDLTQVPRRKTGMGVYGFNLALQLVCREEGVLFVSRDDPDKKRLREALGPGWSLQEVAPRWTRILPLRFLWEQVLLPRICRRFRVDLLHSLHYTTPLFASTPRVVTVPDMSFYLCPEYHTPLKRLYFKGLLPWVLRRVSGVITLSEGGKAELLRRFSSLPHLSVQAIPLGAPEGCRRFPQGGKETFLFLGTREPRKNIEGLLRAYALLVSRDPSSPSLTIVGGRGWGRDPVESLPREIQGRVHVLGYLAEEKKEELLGRAVALVYPSFYEGFGLPVLEAMAQGIPVVTSRGTVMEEVGGGAVLAVDPHSPVEMADAMERLVKEPILWEELSRRGLERAREYTWERTGCETRRFYTECLGGGR